MSIYSKIYMVDKQIANYERLKKLNNEWIHNDHYIDIFGLKNKYVDLIRLKRRKP